MINAANSILIVEHRIVVERAVLRAKSLQGTIASDSNREDPVGQRTFIDVIGRDRGAHGLL